MTSAPATLLPAPGGSALTPREIVAELDKYVVGQAKAKRAVAIALRNRYRRQRLSPELAEEVAPKNILMIGPTGVGKTEIARRLARLADAPFIKVEATKFTEVGYVGKDVDTIIRDLLDVAVKEERERQMRGKRAAAEDAAEERVLDILVPPPRSSPAEPPRSRKSPIGPLSEVKTTSVLSAMPSLGNAAMICPTLQSSSSIASAYRPPRLLCRNFADANNGVCGALYASIRKNGRCLFRSMKAIASSV